jgi:hypothetical protein
MTVDPSNPVNISEDDKQPTTYEVIGCQPIMAGDQPAIVLAVKDGFELVFLLPAQMLSALRGCLEHLESATSDDSLKH